MHLLSTIFSLAHVRVMAFKIGWTTKKNWLMRTFTERLVSTLFGCLACLGNLPQSRSLDAKKHEWEALSHERHTELGYGHFRTVLLSVAGADKLVILSGSSESEEGQSCRPAIFSMSLFARRTTSQN